MEGGDGELLYDISAGKMEEVQLHSAGRISKLQGKGIN